MASIKLHDLPVSVVLDRQAMRSLRGAAGDGGWVLGAFPGYVAPLAGHASVFQVFNTMQEITNNYMYVGQMVNQTTTVNINNSGDNSTNNAVLLTSLGNDGSK